MTKFLKELQEEKISVDEFAKNISKEREEIHEARKKLLEDVEKLDFSKDNFSQERMKMEKMKKEKERLKFLSNEIDRKTERRKKISNERFEEIRKKFSMSPDNSDNEIEKKDQNDIEKTLESLKLRFAYDENIKKHLESGIKSLNSTIDQYKDKIKRLTNRNFIDRMESFDKYIDATLSRINKILIFSLVAMQFYFFYNMLNSDIQEKKIKEKTINDIAGNKKVITAIKKAINSGEKNKNITNILLEGPPGTGKTATTQAVLKELKIKYELIIPSDILGMFIGQSEKNIKYFI